MIQAVTPVSTTPATIAPVTETPAVEAAKLPETAPVTEGTTVKTDLDADSVKQWASLQRSKRDADAKIAQLEKERDTLLPLKTAADKASALEAHIKDGKMLEAAKAAGIDIETAFAEWMSVEQEALSGPPPKELTQLKDKLEAIEARNVEDDKARKAADEANRSIQLKQASEQVSGHLANVLTEDTKAPAPKWLLCASEANRSEALAEAHELVKTAVIEAKGHTFTDEEAGKLFSLAFDQLEEHYQFNEWRKAKETSAIVPTLRDIPRVRESVASRTTVTIDNNRGSIRKPAQSERPYMTLKEVKAELAAKREAR